MNELSLFSGAGGGLLASRWLLGWHTICAVEIDEYCRRVLMQRQDEGYLEPFPIWNDVRTFDGRPWRGLVDVVTAGFPCQPYSTASRGRRVVEDLFGEVERIVAEVQPRWLFCENVLASAYPEQCRRSLLKCCPAGLGAPHHRERQWLVAYADDAEQPEFTVDAEVARVSAVGEAVWDEAALGRVLGMDDGLALRMVRLRALGNGQVPLVAARAWDLLMGRITEEGDDGRRERARARVAV